MAKNNTMPIDGERKVVLRRIDPASYSIVGFIPRSEWETRKAVPGEVIVFQRVLMSAYRHIDPRGWPKVGASIPVALIGNRKFRTGRAVDARLTQYKATRSLERAALKAANEVTIK